MKVYVVAMDCGFEGYEEPKAVFSTLEAAKAYAETCSDKPLNAPWPEIFELVLTD